MNPSTITRAHKNPVRVGTTANITLAGLQTVDSVVLAAGDRVLVKNQTDSRQNGIYLVSTSVWTRAPDADHSDEMLPGTLVYITEGGANGGEFWFLDITEDVDLGNTNLSWSVFATGAGGGIISDHSELTGLSNDDHPQYQLRSEKAASSGYASLDNTTRVPSAQLGTGTANSSVFLRGDRTWTSVPAGVTDHGTLTGLTDDDHPQYRRHYVSVADITARDALTNLVEGMQVYVESTRRVYILDTDLTTWQTLTILPNYEMQEEMDANASIAYLYIASTGNDETGNGSSGAPFREIERAIAAIPPGINGFLEIRALDAGPFNDFHVPELNAKSLFIQIVGAGSSELDLSSMPAGTSDANTAGGSKAGRKRHVAGAHSAISNGTYWIKAGYDFGGRPWTYGFTIDGANSTSPDLSIIGHNQFSPDITTFGFSEIDLVPLTSRIIPREGPFGYISSSNQGNVQVTIIGFYITQFSYLIGDVDAQGCAFRSAGGLVVFTNSRNHYPVFNMYVLGPLIVHGHGSNSIYLSGLMLDTVSLQGVHVSFYGVVRTTSNPQMQVGYSSVTGPRKASSVIMVGDFEGASLRCILAPGGSVRISDNSSTITLDGTQTTFIDIWNYGDVIGTQAFPTVYGSTTGVPIIIRDHAHTLCFTAPGYGTAPYLRNSSSPGTDVQIGGSDGFFNGITVAFSDLPVTELNSGSKVA